MPVMFSARSVVAFAPVRENSDEPGKSSRCSPQRLARRLTGGGVGAMLLWLMINAPSLAAPLRVAIRESVSSLTVGSSTPAKLVDGLGRPVGQIPAMEGFEAEAVSGAVAIKDSRAWQLTVVPEGDGLVFIGDRWYRGNVRLMRTSQGFMAINQVDVEDYLASVIGKEMYVTWPIEALKAQAVASRSYALFKQKKRGKESYDLLSTTSSQVYGGLDGEAPSTREAVKSTRGQILAYNGQVIEAVFHSSSGGHTENSEQVWSSAVPYLKGVEDFDQNAPVYQWTVNFTAAQLRQRLPGVGNIKALTPVQTTPNGRVRQIKITGDAGSQTMSGDQVRKALGLKSALFTAEPQSQAGLVAGTPTVGAPSTFVVSGRGYGHGIGMSQWGAHGMAQQGKTFQEIVLHYYPGTQIITVTP